MGILDDIREVETPGKHGGNFFYAQVVYGNFSDIEKLKADGYSLATICKHLEKKGALPQGSDPRSFRRAFRREIARRKRTMPHVAAVNGTAKQGIKGKESAPKDEHQAAIITPPRASGIQAQSGSGRAEHQVRHDGTFPIIPIDPDDLP